MLFINDKDMTGQIKIACTHRKLQNVFLEHDVKIGRRVMYIIVTKDYFTSMCL